MPRSLVFYHSSTHSKQVKLTFGSHLTQARGEVERSSGGAGGGAGQGPIRRQVGSYSLTGFWPVVWPAAFYLFWAVLLLSFCFCVFFLILCWNRDIFEFHLNTCTCIALADSRRSRPSAKRSNRNWTQRTLKSPLVPALRCSSQSNLNLRRLQRPPRRLLPPPPHRPASRTLKLQAVQPRRRSE